MPSNGWSGQSGSGRDTAGLAGAPVTVFTLVSFSLNPAQNKIKGKVEKEVISGDNQRNIVDLRHKLMCVIIFQRT